MEAEGQPKGPLAGLVVVEMGSVLAAPFCGHLLADLGATVWKVEPPGSGDIMRVWGSRKTVNGKGLFWPIISRNKKSVACDLRVPEGQAVARRMVQQADVLVENFRTGRLAAWGLGNDELLEINPRLVIASVTGFGQTGPYASDAGFGGVAEAMGGLRALIGEPDRPPARAGVSIGDSLAGYLAAVAILSAVHERERSGKGQVIDVAIYEAVLSVMESLLPEWTIAGHLRTRTGATIPHVAPAGLYETLDGKLIVVVASTDATFARLLETIEAEDLLADRAYTDLADRMEKHEEIEARLTAWTEARSAQDVLDIFRAAGVAAGLIYEPEDMLRDPQFNARSSIVSPEDSTLGPVSMQNVFPRFSRTPGGISWLGPELGEHTEEVLATCGYQAEEISRLRSTGVVT